MLFMTQLWSIPLPRQPSVEIGTTHVEPSMRDHLGLPAEIGPRIGMKAA